MFSRTGHSIEVLGFALGEPHPPRRARTFVGQTAGCRTKVHLAPVRRRVQFRHSQRTIPLSKRQLRNEKSRADSPLQYYEDPQGLKNAVVGHARPPEPPRKTAWPCGQMDSNRHMTAWISMEKRFLQINISGFTDFRNSGNIHPKRDSCTFMDIALKIRHDKSSIPQIIKR